MGRRSRKPIAIGLVGPIGAGKSAVAGLFGRLGAEVIDADALAHRALDVPAIRRRIVRRWGADVVDGSGDIDRRRLGERVFRNPAALKRLESWVHPWVDRQMNLRTARAARTGKGAVVLDVPLLVEAGLHRRCDAVVCVSAPLAVRILRVRARGWTPGELRRRQKLQMPYEEKKTLCTHEIQNGGTLAQTRAQVRRVWKDLQRRLYDAR